jgi:hypothetical protein
MSKFKTIEIIFILNYVYRPLQCQLSGSATATQFIKLILVCIQNTCNFYMHFLILTCIFKSVMLYSRLAVIYDCHTNY